MRNVLGIGVASALLAACTVGPDYVRPDAPRAETFVQAPATAQVAGGETTAEREFWRAFDDPQLSTLVERALLQNHDVRIALARYDQARALSRDASYARLPQLDANAQAERVRSSADQAPGVDRDGRDTHNYVGGLGVSWELDLFGRLRRASEASHADAQAASADLAAMQVAIAASVAQGWFELRGLQAQLDIARENAATQERTLKLLQARTEAGFSDAFDVDRGRAQLEATLARIPSLEAAEAVAANRIAVLVGATPESMAAELMTSGALPTLPAAPLPGTPSDLLRRRPDVAAAERRVAAATARVGVATADLFPRFSLGALFGTQALGSGALFARDSETRVLSLGLDGGFLNVGRVRARIAAANAQSAQDLAAYQQTVLRALEDTENALVRVDRSRTELAHLDQAAQAGTRAAQVARLRLDNGAIDTLDMLEAERTRLESQDAAVQGRVRSGVAMVQLYAALAGGWPEYVAAESLPPPSPGTAAGARAVALQDVR
ncbi:efflux transporter outer membrane subunit [Pseudoxanthomonas sp. X-1]|uniref:efflux transporter outer membrane subunit n=1 Tax=Pseudoxanthomonas sp. X-1 TaxID=2571115 RepID=UPI00197D496B|nr:efflux transporter outer membrane subunit [Pseudoxanthomonas sp. X-1]UAY73148.1 efflux transporter outer membrane subunit [Pseudoxanthomonas sp. X-1]